MTEKPPATPLPSATVLLVRDGEPGLQVFMVQRHHRIDVATGATVFPGGKVDASDVHPLLRKHARGVADLEDAGLAVRMAAIRETFEEVGVLLARPQGHDELVRGRRLGEIEERHREALRRSEITLAEIVTVEKLDLACDLLVPFAHWITPEAVPKRFDTHFFLTLAPTGQVALHDGEESVNSLWITPDAALAEAAAGRRTIVFPTLLNLRKLGRSKRVDQALAAARSAHVVTVLPRVEVTPAGPVLRIPAEAGYDVVEAPVPDLFPTRD